MEYEEDYKMWLEEMFIKMNPDWICDGMTGKELTHDWCEKYCGKDSDYLTPKCLHMYYHHIATADRKTEPSNSEKPNNSNDLIRKSDVLETYADLYDIFDDNKAIQEELHKVFDKINDIPTVEPNNCEELNAYRECVKSRSFWDSKHCDGCYFDERCPFDEPKDEPQTDPLPKAINGVNISDAVAWADKWLEDNPVSEMWDMIRTLRDATEWQDEPLKIELTAEDLQDWKDRMWAEAIVTEPTISKMEQVDKDINVRSKDEEYINNLPWTEVGNGEQTEREDE